MMPVVVIARKFNLVLWDHVLCVQSHAKAGTTVSYAAERGRVKLDPIEGCFSCKLWGLTNHPRPIYYWQTLHELAETELVKLRRCKRHGRGTPTH
jgi:hypothetical protein